MTQGLMVFGPAGEVWLEVTNRLTRYVGRIDLPGSPNFTNGSLFDGGLNSGDPWYYIIEKPSDTNGMWGTYAPNISISNGTISWSKDSDGRVRVFPCTVIYGVY